jgi:sarcosine reductase
MKLTLDIIHIKKISFGNKTLINDNTLFVNQAELQNIINSDNRFDKVNIDLINPGDECRVVQIFDIVEPRAKLEGENFPGILGKMKTVGNGHTLVLRGTSVITIDYTGGSRGGVFDMTGPISKYNIYSNLSHLVLQCHPKEGISKIDYHNALRIANLKAAVYLAEAGKGLPIDETEIYALPPLIDMTEKVKKLPRVAYIYQIHTLQQSAEHGEPILYGDDTMRLLPTIIHPNEILDGALVRGFYSRAQETYSMQNHPIIKGLYSKHGTEICFIGVIIVVATTTNEHRQRSSMMAANLAKSILGAKSAILTKTGGGAPHVDMGWTAEICEESGIKTVMIVHDQSNDARSETSLLYSSEKVDAVVNVGSWNREIKLPPMPLVIGGPVDFNGKSANEDIVVSMRTVFGALNQVGASKLTMREI